MLPCFLRGIHSFLLASIRSARTSFARVWRGSITSSIQPFSAARYGFAKRVENSSTLDCRKLSGSADDASSRRYRMLTAPSGPITAISAVG